MNDWSLSVLLSLSEALLWGRVASLFNSHLDFGFTPGNGFAVIFVSHLLGQWAARGAMTYGKKRNSRGHGSGRSGPGEVRPGRLRDALDVGPRRSLFLAWAGVLMGICGCLGIIRKATDYSSSWLYTVMALAVLSSAAGINTVTKRLTSQGALKKLVFGSIVFFIVSLTRLSPETAVLRDTVLYLLVSSMFIIRQRSHEVAGWGVASRRHYWNAGSVIVVLVAMCLALTFCLSSSAGRELVTEFFRRLGPVLETTLKYVLMPVGYLIQWLVVFLKRFARTDGSTLSFEVNGALEELQKLKSQDRLWIMPVWLKWLLAGSLLIACFALLWLFISRILNQAEPPGVSESRVSLASKGAVKEWFDLTLNEGKQKLKKSLQRFRRLVIFREPGNLEELYAGTTEFMSQKGFPRHPASTPFEYLGHVEARIESSEAIAYLRTISVVFSRCHYSGKKPEEAEWRLALSAYRSLLRYQELQTGDETFGID